MILSWLTDWKFWGSLVEGAFILAITYYGWRKRRESATKGEIHDEIQSGDSALGKQLQASNDGNRRKFGRVHARLDDIAGRQDRHGERLTQMETAIKSLPSHVDLGEIYDKINQVQKDTTTALAVSRSTNALMQTINSYLIQRENKT